jgi:2-polyprenyl-3-methyl-5-hydroxy-6-metoxy-1,4-benzoquinol methylase
MTNYYDRIAVDIDSCHSMIKEGFIMPSNRLYRLDFFSRFLYRARVYDRLVDAGLIRGWFDEFAEFWTKALGGRPLKLHDFFYLHSHYRAGFQKIEVQNNADRDQFLEAWQKFENVFLLFSSTYRYALHPFSYRPFRQFLPTGGRVLEYGCGFAPIVTSMIRSGRNRFDYTIADIRTLNYAFTKYRLLSHGVNCVDVVPFRSNDFKQTFDTIFLLTVLEHLPNPSEVVEELTSCLKPGGFLIFDYILSEGKGLDTLSSVEFRLEVLQFLRKHFQPVLGEFSEDTSMGTTVIRKKG